MKLEIGICSAKPRTNEINPKETAAVYQLANRTEIITKTVASPTRSRKIRLMLNWETRFGIRPMAKISMALATVRRAKTIVTPRKCLVEERRSPGQAGASNKQNEHGAREAGEPEYVLPADGNFEFLSWLL